MTDEPTVSDVLEAAADLIEPEGAWRQDWWASTADGAHCEPIDKRAACWCVRGAINRVVRGVLPTGSVTKVPQEQIEAEEWLARVVPTKQAANRQPDTSGWNDAPERTQAEVVSALRQAALQAREGK